MKFQYSAVTKTGGEKSGTIEATTEDGAISALQRRDLIVISVLPIARKSLWEMDITLFERVAVKDVVVMSRQIATLFDAQVSALKAFSMLATEVENPLLQRKLEEIANDIQGGITISDALSKHPSVFSNFYVNMIRSGEESGKLSETFLYLADYLDRNYELSSKARSALIYPMFVIGVFVIVMLLLLTLVVPQLKGILESTGQEVPGYTKAVLSTSDFLVDYGIFAFFAFVIILTLLWYLSRIGTLTLANVKMKVPILGSLFTKLYLSRISDNLFTMLTSGVPMVKALEVTADVVDNMMYEKILRDSTELVKSGAPLSEALSGYDGIPPIMVMMMKVGEETGELASILKVLAKFYRREVENAIDGLIGLIEPIMIVVLGLGVGIVLASVLMPIYDIAGV